MFCEIINAPFIITFIVVVIGWIIVCAILYAIHPAIGGIYTLCACIAYIRCTVKEFQNGHIFHGIVPIIPIALLIILSIYVSIEETKNEKIRQIEIPQIPERVEKYIASNGYTSPKDFIKYSDDCPEFQTARTVTYTNPLYTEQVEANKKRKANKQEPLEVTEPSMISYGKFAAFKYKEIVLTYFMPRLEEVLKTIYMFDYDNLYDAMPDFYEFFKKDDGSIDKVYFAQACIGIVNKSIKNNIIEKVGDAGGLYRSKIIPEEEGNVVEGEILEI